jgi:hypothetical protein
MEIKDMSFEQFIQWATGYILFGIGSGRSLKVLVWEILNNFTQNWLPWNGWKKI